MARLERRTVETRSGNRPVLVLPVDTEGLLLVASTSGPRMTDQDRRILSFAASELSRVSEQLELLKAAEEAEKLQARDEAKNALLAAVSHDLRTPLASMKVAVTTVLEPTLNLSDAQRHRLLDTVNNEVDRLGGMIDHLLDLSRLESGAFRLSQDQVDLTAWCTTPPIEFDSSSGRQIQVDSTDDSEVVGDQVRLLEVVTNLIDNAARYSTPGTPILVTLRPEQGSVIVAITDEGPGHDPRGTGESLPAVHPRGQVGHGKRPRSRYHPVDHHRPWRNHRRRVKSGHGNDNVGQHPEASPP